MIVESVELKDYRNYEFLDIQFDKGTNILYGDNAQGKTNILESIYVAATTKSHKSSKDKEIVNFNKEEAHIRTYLEKEGVETRVDTRPGDDFCYCTANGRACPARSTEKNQGCDRLFLDI